MHKIAKKVVKRPSSFKKGANKFESLRQQKVTKNAKKCQKVQKRAKSNLKKMYIYCWVTIDIHKMPTGA